MSTPYRFHHSDGRVFEEDGAASGREPVVGDWLGFEEDVLLVTAVRGARAFDVIPHPKADEITAAMLDTDVPRAQAWENARQVAYSVAVPAIPFEAFEDGLRRVLAEGGRFDKHFTMAPDLEPRARAALAPGARPRNGRRMMPITREESQAIWAKVKANHARLDACPGPHAFEDVTLTRTLNKHYRCTLCGGEVDAVAKRWYEHGLKHGQARTVEETPR